MRYIADGRVPFKPMFDQITVSSIRRRQWALGASIAVHCVALFLVLRPPSPQLVKVQQLRHGNDGLSLTRLYWHGERMETALSDPDRKAKSELSPEARSKNLQSPGKSLQLRLERHERTIAANVEEHSSVSGKSRDSATAGSTYGSLSNGDLSGTEVRPALWVAGPNPEVAASEFAEGLQGSVIVEITIDEQGNVVATQLLQGLSPAVDSRVIEALQMAHFVPAKRNGVAIASKQDVYYHFPH